MKKLCSDEFSVFQDVMANDYDDTLYESIGKISAKVMRLNFNDYQSK